ncbi:MAG: fibronectin type III domain-containing protein [Planctomycetota bacterium]
MRKNTKHNFTIFIFSSMLIGIASLLTGAVGDGGGCLGTQSNIRTFTGSSSKNSNMPCVTTNPATNVTSNSATLNSTVNPNCLATTTYFEWGPTTSYGSSTISQLIGSGTSDVAIMADISGLSTSTLYNFRVVATNSAGTTYGANQNFTTP